MRINIQEKRAWNIKHFTQFYFESFKILFFHFQIMHLFVALILINDDSTALIGNLPDSVHCQKSKEPLNRKFNLHNFLRDKLLEPNILKMYGKYNSNRFELNSMNVSSIAYYKLIVDFLKNKFSHFKVWLLLRIKIWKKKTLFISESKILVNIHKNGNKVGGYHINENVWKRHTVFRSNQCLCEYDNR